MSRYLPRTKVAATLISISALKKNHRIPSDGSRNCDYIFEVFDECMSTSSPDDPNSCYDIKELMASCPGHKRDPSRRSVLEEDDEKLESLRREAIAAGFASLNEYFHYQSAKTRGMCSIAYNLYTECMNEDGARQGFCDSYRNEFCPQFKQAP